MKHRTEFRHKIKAFLKHTNVYANAGNMLELIGLTMGHVVKKIGVLYLSNSLSLYEINLFSST